LCLLLKSRDIYATVFHPSDRQCIALHKFHLPERSFSEVNLQALARLYASVPMLSHRYRHVRVACFTEGIQLVPSELHAAVPGLLNEWGTPPQSSWADEQVSDGTTLWHCMRDDWREWFSKTFDGAIPGHSATPMLRYWLRHHNIQDKPLVRACISDHLLEVFVTGPKGLLLANSFRCQTAEDFLYFIILVYQQLGLDTHEVPLEISGEIVPESQLYQLLYKYIRHIEGAGMPDGVSFASDLSEVRPYYYLNQLCMAL
jgi:hypothetical protein